MCEIWFSDGKSEYHIIRGLSPAIFEIWKDGKMINQDSKLIDYQEMLETQILKMDFQSFTQIVLLGKATYVAFLRLKQHERRKFIENVLGLTIFGDMAEINKIKMSQLKEKIQQNKNDLALLKQKKQMIESHIIDIENEIIKQKLEATKVVDDIIFQISSSIDDLRKKRLQKESEFIIISGSIDGLNSKLHKCFDYKRKIQSKLSQSKKRLDFFSNNNICPTCESSIDDEKKKIKSDEIESSVVELNQAMEKIERLEKETSVLIGDISSKLNKNQEINTSINQIDTQILRLENEIDQIRNKPVTSPSNLLVQQKKDDLKVIVDEITDKSEIRSQLIEEMKCHDVIYSMLKDGGIKTLIIKEHIPKINRIMNDYLKYLGLFSTFSIDEEFDEKILSRGFDALPYNAYSEGQKLRIDIAMLMTWREICKSRNNMNVNVLVFDEILDGSADENGTECFVQLFKQLERDGVKIIVISHSGARWEERFSEMWTVKEKEGYSVIEQ